MNILIASEHVVDNYILGKRMKPRAYGQYGLLITVVDVLAGDVVAEVRRGRCPFCGRSFPSRGAVARHLKSTAWGIMKVGPCGSDWHWVYEVYPRNPCAFKYAKLVEFLASAYVRFRNAVRCAGEHGLRLVVDGRSYGFRNSSEVADFIRRNPDVLKVVVDVA